MSFISCLWKKLKLFISNHGTNSAPPPDSVLGAQPASLAEPRWFPGDHSPRIYLGWHLPDASLPFCRWAPGGLRAKCHRLAPNGKHLSPSHSLNHSACWQAAWHYCRQVRGGLPCCRASGA